MKLIKTLLIANRGEIATRIVRTARALGLKTVAVYSDADKHAGHVKAADLAIPIGPSPASASYLNSDAILRAARESGADAIHPGYGFLSENPDFARAVMDAGLIFVGPSAFAIEIMGDKARAKQHLEGYDVPLIPGYDGDDQSDEALIKAAEKTGFPVMIKAAAGGGGKGMRLVDGTADMSEALKLARSEALNSFANDRLIIEKALVGARHIEVQVFGDSLGNLVHLFERDCSVQRRHQKIIEEAPAAGISDTVRSKLYAAALAVARSVDYVGAGTVEFLMMPDESFYFLEMNTRLQVEHPVTEWITGLDLIAWQLTVASGKPLPLTQDQITKEGHAIEVRLCCEDPENGFLPTLGTLSVRERSTSKQDGIKARFDSPNPFAGIDSTIEVAPFYDSMVGKIIAGGPDRETAIDTIIDAVANIAARGVITNRDFLLDILGQQAFRDQPPATDFLTSTYDLDAVNLPIFQDTLAAIAAKLYMAQDPSRHHNWSPSELDFWSNDGAIRSPLDLGPLGMGSVSRVGNFLSFQVGDFDPIEIDPASCWVEDFEVIDETLWFVDQYRTLPVPLRPHYGAWSVGGSGNILAPMHGTLIEILVTKGDMVDSGQPIAVLEAMKMQHQLLADIAGTVTELSATKGEQIAADSLIATITPKGDA